MAESRQHGAKNVRIFGSFARGTQRKTSDIDLLVEMEEGRTLLDLIALERSLGRRLGRRIDVLTERLSQPSSSRSHPCRNASVMRDGYVYLRHIADALARIDEYVPKERRAFVDDTQCQDAVMRNLAVIGEAVKKVPTSIRSQHPEVPWKEIAGMRDVLIHDYVSVDIALVWDTVRRDLPILRAAVASLLDRKESEAA